MVSCRACFRASLFLLTAWFRSDTWRDRGHILDIHMHILGEYEMKTPAAKKNPPFCLTFDLYHSSASAMFLAAMPSYCALMSLSAAVKSGLDMSIWICTWVSCICAWSSRISCRGKTEGSRVRRGQKMEDLFCSLVVRVFKIFNLGN